MPGIIFRGIMRNAINSLWRHSEKRPSIELVGVLEKCLRLIFLRRREKMPQIELDGVLNMSLC